MPVIADRCGMIRELMEFFEESRDAGPEDFLRILHGGRVLRREE